ncbi:flagellar hook assembly protein FlgD [uncultured Clostridium sp.]|uniref:flagellar hook assembly protein FlgD n=1 Tax=uncultured Clostridium sp. TaxID=59620 RepID=UPI00267275BC|nr:flagellar hook capping FlgD N-terminal domain-containing protein [uncultured Clostridium sp.]
MSDISTISGQSRAGGNYTVGGKTDRGTSIVEAGGSVDKNAFLQILVAELSNLDPTADTDSTQYISQLAQFSTMEQMSNLNTTMSNSAAYNLVGKGVTVNVLDNKGVPYTGIVRGVSGSNGTSYTVSVEVYEDNQTKYIDVPMNSIQTVLDVGDSSLSALNNMNTNIAMMTASSYIGKYVELTESKENGNNEKVTGQVMSVSRENGAINIKVKLLDGEVKTYDYSLVEKVQDTPI